CVTRDSWRRLVVLGRLPLEVRGEGGSPEAGAGPAGPRHCNGQVVAARRHWETGKAGRTPEARRPLRSRHLEIPRGRDGGAPPLTSLAHNPSRRAGRRSGVPAG